MDERRGAWGRLLALFALLHHGDSKGNWIRGRGGRLFDPAVYPFLQGQEKAGDAPAPAPVSDGCILRILDLADHGRRREALLPHARRRADRQRL